MMRVLILFSASDLGGAERSLTRMALAASGSGIRYDLATLAGFGDWVPWARSLGLSPIVFGAHPEKGARHKIGVAALWQLIALIRRERYAAIYVIGLRPSILLRLLRPLLRGAKLVHGIRWNPASQSRLDQLFRLVERLGSALVDHYICNSRAAAQVLEHRLHVPAHKISVIYNGLSELPDLGEPRENAPVALTIANLAVRKGQREYLDIIATLPRHSGEKFVFVGRDGLGGAFQSDIARLGLGASVVFRGFVKDVERELRQARVMVLPSLHNEGTPTSILESYAFGVPVVAYAIDGIPEIVEDGVTGFLVRPGDTKAFGACVQRLLDDVDLARRMGLAGRALVEQRFTIRHCVEQHAASFATITTSATTERA